MPRSNLNIPKRGLSTDEVRKSSSKAHKSKKSPTLLRKSVSEINDPDRLTGGADTTEVEQTAEMSASPEEEVGDPVAVVPEETKTENDTENVVSPSGPCCFCMGQTAASTGDKKVDEMIDYVHQNLQEAGKALATLSENFEHDSKLMFVDILGRIQQWTSAVQNKLDNCKLDIEALRKELIARMCEIANLKAQLAQCEQQKEELKQTKTAEASTHTEHDTLFRSAIADKTQAQTEVEEQPEDPRIVERKSKDQTEKAQEELAGKTADLTDAAVQICTRDKEKMKREIELEGEISRLRKENERIVKDRAEYENAIQRALLRGVSSLNVEALRVLRCPPIPCCSPCAPCPASASATAEPITSCKTAKDISGHGTSKIYNNCQRNDSAKSSGHERGSCTVKRPCASPCCSAGKSRKSTTDSSMIFLLRQGDAGNICSGNDNPMPRACGSPMMKKIEIPPCPRFSR